MRALRDAAASRVAEAEGVLDDHDPRAPRDGTILRLHKRLSETVLATERIDYRVVEAWIALSADCRLPVGTRADVLVCPDEADRGCSNPADPEAKPPDHPRDRVVTADR